MGKPTKELCARLDELGVAWWQRKCHTCWKVEKEQGTEHWRAWPAPDGTITLKVDAIYGLTPEQAIAATIGTPMDADLRKALDTMRIWISEDAHLGESPISHELEKEEGLRNLDAIEQAIAATVGAGTCKDLGGIGADGEVVFNCSECGCVLSVFDKDGMNNLCTSFIYDYPRFCPNCGRRIKEEDE